MQETHTVNLDTSRPLNLVILYLQLEQGFFVCVDEAIRDSGYSE